MGRVVAITNHKGGSGKTTTATNLAAALRLKGFDVLIIDADAQANATQTFRAPTDGGTTFDTIKEPVTPYVQPYRVYGPTESAGVLDILPSSRELSTLDVTQSEDGGGLRLKNVASKYKPKYDFIFIDTPPTLGFMILAALLASEEIIAPSRPNYYDLEGLGGLDSTIGMVNTFRPFDLVFTLLLTQYDGRKVLHRRTLDILSKDEHLRMFKTPIRDNVALAEAPTAGKDIFAYAPQSNGARDYAAVADEYIALTHVKHVDHHYKG